jgi:hypothetical protein
LGASNVSWWLCRSGGSEVVLLEESVGGGTNVVAVVIAQHTKVRAQSRPHYANQTINFLSTQPPPKKYTGVVEVSCQADVFQPMENVKKLVRSMFLPVITAPLLAWHWHNSYSHTLTKLKEIKSKLH